MKHFTKLILFSFLLVLAACQNDTVEDTMQQEEVAKAVIKVDDDGNVIGDGKLAKDELMFNENSENLVMSRNNASFQKTNSSTSSTCSVDLLDTGLNSVVNIEVLAKPGANAYFDVSLDGGESTPAYCSDRLPSLGADDDFIDFTAVSTYDDAILEGGAFESVYTNPQNFDKVNWILNNIDISEGSEFTYGHVQYAIWRLIEGPYVNDFTDFLTQVPGDWRPAIDNAKGDEIFELSVANGEGYEPTCGEKLGVLLIPADFDNVQALVIAKDIPEAEVEECDDCIGKVTDLTLNWNWHDDYRVRVYQQYENTCYAVKVFDDVVGLNDDIAVTGANHDGSFGKWLYIYVGNCYYTKIKTNCYLNIGPGYKSGVLEVVSGTSSHGGELCEYIEPAHYCYWW
ncbi:hypothetical protein [uncultured Winogradskyella sp.]|uniref:hypothetical protein n=1 Tax=uncultured Winogradskyella sp. TaxID=395353 RepID=UPI00260EB2F7|nr:hypothetical protein [uncultured Winogradskyella sp.]